MTSVNLPSPGIGHNNPPTLLQTLKDDLSSKHEESLQTARELVLRRSELPAVVETDEQAAMLTDFIKAVTNSEKSIEAIRIAEKEPYLNAGRLVDSFFNTVKDTLGQAKLGAKKPLDAFLKKKADEEREIRMAEAKRLQEEAEEKARLAAALEAEGQKREARVELSQAIHTEAMAAKTTRSVMAKPSDMARTRTETGSMASLATRWVGEMQDRSTLDLEALRPYLAEDALQKAINLYVRAGGRNLKGATIYEQSNTVVR